MKKLISLLLISGLSFGMIGPFPPGTGGGGGGGGSGVTTVGTFSGSSQTNGASISGSTITFGPADTTNPGMVSTGSQVFAGIKRFQDNLYVGTAPSSAVPFSVDGTATLASGSYFANLLVARRTVSSTDSNSIYGTIHQAVVSVDSGQTQNATVAGALLEAKPTGAGNFALAAGGRAVVTNSGTGTITDAVAYRAGTATNTGGGTITNNYGFQTANQTVGTNNYGFYSAITSGTGKYSFYDAGGAANYFAGKTNIGSVNAGGFGFVADVNPVVNSGTEYGSVLVSRKTLSTAGTNPQIAAYGDLIIDVAGNTQSGLASGTTGAVVASGSSGTVSSAAGVSGIVSNIAAGAVTNASSLHASAVTNTGGGSIVSAYGVYAENQTAGTNNYGVYSAVTSGSNKYAFMDAGGADSYFKGNIIKINNVTTNWPSSQGSANTYLKNDGSGNLSWASVSGGSGDVVGPASSVDGDVSTFNGTTGKLIRSEAKFNINPTTGYTSRTWAGAPPFALMTWNLGTATTWSDLLDITGAIASTSTNTYLIYADPSKALSGTQSFTGYRTTPSFSGTTSGIIRTHYDYMAGSGSGAAWGGYHTSSLGVHAYDSMAENIHSTGGAGGFIGGAIANNALAISGVSTAAYGSSGKALGVRGKAANNNSPSIIAGGYFSLDANWDSGTESEVFPNVSAALVANNGDTTKDIFALQDNGSTVVQVTDGAIATVTGSLVVVTSSTLGGSTKITRQFPASVVALTDAATVSLDASLGNTFSLTAAGDRTIAAPTNPQDGQRIIIRITASGGSRTITLTTGSAGAFRYGTDITALTATSSGLTDYVGCIYNLSADRWDVVAYVKGY